MCGQAAAELVQVEYTGGHGWALARTAVGSRALLPGWISKYHAQLLVARKDVIVTRPVWPKTFTLGFAFTNHRAALAAKEAELASRHQALAGVEAKIAGLTAKFEKSLHLISEDRRLVATYQRELEGRLDTRAS